MDRHSYDCIIIGGGPAGLTAAIYAARANLAVIVLESSITGGLVNSTYMVENFPSYPGIHGMELMEKMREHVDALGVPVEELCEITALDLSGDIKAVATEDAVYAAPAVILATGRTPVALDVPTECEEIHYCSVCDGAAYAGKNVLVVGGGNSAFDESLYLLSLGVRHITLIEVMDRFFAAESTQQALQCHENVSCLTTTEVKDLTLENGKLASALLCNAQTGEEQSLPVDGVFVFLGQKPNNDLFAASVTLDSQGYIPAGPDMSTNIPGVFAAGDIVA
ncbi:FAD-dependent oxidoreductase, partial [Desulfovibrio sp. OttesenSCG-928-I05]|nr:FAD-dependent oxidoreductase [Desulfovibrio sp. OttesenSCG-928-I05]